MGDDIDDGAGPDICEEGGLGFKPQRRELSNNVLPYANQLDTEIVQQLTSIKTGLILAVSKADIVHGTLYWIDRLHRYVKLYGFCFTKKDHVAFVELLYELVIVPRQDVWVTIRVGQTLVLLLHKVSLLTPDDLQLQWRPLYDLYKKLFHNALAYERMLQLPSHCEATLCSIIRHCRPYFAAGTTEDLLEEFLPKLCPFDEQMNRSIKFLDLFMPVSTRQNGRLPSHDLWRPLMLDMMRNSPYWEPTAFSLIARLAWKNIGIVDWEDELPLFFTKVLRQLKLPVGYKSIMPYKARGCDNTSVAMFIVANLGGGSSCQLHLNRLVSVVESYLHPSNAGLWTSGLMDTFNKITLYFNKRINREWRPHKTWEAAIPANRYLTDADVDAFVKCLLPVVLTAMFGRVGTSEAAMILGRLAALRTKEVLTQFLDLMYPALTSSTEPARLHACLQTGVLTARSLVTGGRDFPSGPTHVLPLLRLLLPGIDPNDISKTMSTFQLVTTYTTLVPLADCSDAPSKVDVTEEEAELCQQSSELLEFLLVFLERCLSIVENSVSVQHTSASTGGTGSASGGIAIGLSKEETLLEAGMAFTIRSIFQQAHPDIAKVLVRRLASHVIGRTLETGVSGQLLSNICRAVAKAQPSLLLSALVPPLSRLLVSLTASEAAQKEERPDSEVMFNLLILSEIIQCRCDVAVHHVAAVTDVLSQCLLLSCVPAQQLAVTLLGNTLTALTATATFDYRSVANDWEEPYETFLPIRHWGALIEGGWKSMRVQWVEPKEEQQRAVDQLLKRFLLPEMDRLDRAAKDLTTLTKEELQHSLLIVQESLNAGPMLPPWEEEPIPLLDTVLPPAPQFKLSSRTAALEVHFTVSDRPSNVRQAVAATALNLARAMLDAESDNTKAYNTVVNILWAVGQIHSIKRTDFESRWRTLSQVQTMLRYSLLGPSQRWHRVRHVVIQRANLQHLQRTLESVESRPFTDTDKNILLAAGRLATSHYSQVRIGGQQLLRNMLMQFPGTYRLLLPMLCQNLALNPTEHHKTFKGTLYVLMGNKCRSVLVQHDWPALQQLWPALLTAQHSEKPSVVFLLSQLVELILEHTEMIAIEQQHSDSLAQRCRKAAALFEVPPPKVDPTEVSAHLAAEADRQREVYLSLVAVLAEHVTSGRLHWRYEHMGVAMLGSLIRTDVPFPGVGVRGITNALVHNNVHVRKMAVYYLSNVLRCQKRPHVKVDVDSHTLSGGCQQPGTTAQQSFRPGVDRPDNRWMQYDSASADMTEEQYNERKFIHSTYLGFTTWPKTVQMYAALSEQPSLQRCLSELNEGELEVYNFFNSPDKLAKLVEFLSLEDQRGSSETFDWRRMAVWKGLFRNFGTALLPVLKPHMERMAADPAEASQRCAAEIWAGFVRSTKHWPYDDWRDAMSLSTTVLRSALTAMSAEALDNWYRAVSRISMDRDPAVIAPLLEELITFPDLLTTGSFPLQCRLFLCFSLLQQQEWRVMAVLQRVLDKLMSALSHPYKAVRDRISSLLFKVFCHDTRLFYDGTACPAMPACGPDLGVFVDYVLGQLGSLHEYSGGNGSTEGKVLLATAGPHIHDAGTSAGVQATTAMEHMVEAMAAAVGGEESTGRSRDDGVRGRDEEGAAQADGRRVSDDDDPAVDRRMLQEDSSSVPSSAESEREMGGKRNSAGAEVAESRGALLPSPVYDGPAGETDERKNAFRIINTMCKFVQLICSKNHTSTPPPLYKLLGALCQLESVDCDVEVCSNCASALCIIGQSLVRRQDVLPLLLQLQEITEYRWWRARSAALHVLQMLVFHNALIIMAEAEAPPLVLRTVLQRLLDERLEVRDVAAGVLASLLHTRVVGDGEDVRKQLTATLRKEVRGSRRSSSWAGTRMVAIHGTVLGLTAFVRSAPYSVPAYLPEVLCTLAQYINLPQPIAGSIRDCLSNFRRTHHDNWQEHKQHFTADQLDTLSDLLLSPSYYA